MRRMKEADRKTNESNTSRAKYQCPPLLAEIINDVNRLPKDEIKAENQIIEYLENSNYSVSITNLFFNFENFVVTNKALLQKAFDFYFSEKGFDAKDHLDLITYEICVLCNSSAHKELNFSHEEAAIYILDWFDAFEEKNGTEILNHFETFHNSLPNLYKEAKNLKRLIRYKSFIVNHKYIELKRIEIETSLIFDGNTIRVIKSRFLRAIEGVNIDRLRVCEVCTNIYWAVRSDSKTCSRNCYNTFRQRQFREKNKNEYNEKRRANYAYKKTINKVKEK